MDIPINDLKAVFGDFEKLQKNQTKVLSDLYKILTGEKTLPSTNRSNSFFDKLNPEKAVDREERDEQKGKTNKADAGAVAKKEVQPRKVDNTAVAKKEVQPRKVDTAISAVVKKEALEPKEKKGSNRVVATIIFGPKAISILDNHFKNLSDKLSSGYSTTVSTNRDLFKNLSGRLEIASRVMGKKIWDGIKGLGTKFKDYSKLIGTKIMTGLKGISFKGIGDKISNITGGIGRGFGTISGMFKGKKEEPNKDGKSTKTPYNRQTVDVVLPPKTRVVLEDILEGANVSLFDKFKPYLENITATISKAKFGDKGKKKDGMLGFLKDVFPLVARLLGPVIGSLGLILAGGAAAIGSVALLINGLFDSGPLKGLKKLLGRGGLALAKGLIQKGITRLNKAVTTLTRFIFGKKAVDGVLKPIQKGLSDALKTLGELPGKLFKSIGKGLKGIFGNLTGKVAGTIAKSGGKGLISRLAGTAGKFLLKGLKRLPLIGTLIGFGFAISRIVKGDFIGGLLDIASALASAVPVVGTALSIAIDIFSAYRDTKTGGSEKAGKAQMGWIGSIGKWLWNAFKKIPVIGPMAQGIGALFTGKFKDAFAFFGEAASETPLGMLVSFLSTNKTVKKAASATSSWIGSIGKWLWNAFKKIPVIGSMAQGIGSLFTGKFKEAFSHFGDAASETPLGQLITFFTTNKTVKKAAATASNWIGSLGKWIWSKFKKIPIIGPMAQAVGALFSGKFKEAFKFFGEAASETPLGMLGSFLYSSLPTPAKAKADGALSSIGKFFSSIKDKMLRAILKFIPEKILGISVRSRVAKMLGISDKEGTDEEHKGTEVKGEKLQAATPIKAVQKSTSKDLKIAPEGVDQKDWDALNDKQKQGVLKQYEKIESEKDMDKFKANVHKLAIVDKIFKATGLLKDKDQAPPPTAQPATPKIPKTEQPTEPQGPGLGDVHSTLKEQNNLILKLLGFNKQTANNTGGLLGSMNNPSNNVSVVNVTSNPTAYLTNPMSSTDFRSQMFAR